MNSQEKTIQDEELIRITISLKKSTYIELFKLADKAERSLSYTGASLIEKGLKDKAREKARKRKNNNHA
ncbi:MAG: hypothetical protein JSS67_02500 [Bacteroidetes bacterium]|nr:hypothetical protein [Bacteroidota bacterium]